MTTRATHWDRSTLETPGTRPQTTDRTHCATRLFAPPRNVLVVWAVGGDVVTHVSLFSVRFVGRSRSRALVTTSRPPMLNGISWKLSPVVRPHISLWGTGLRRLGIVVFLVVCLHRTFEHLIRQERFKLFGFENKALRSRSWVPYSDRNRSIFDVARRWFRALQESISIDVWTNKFSRNFVNFPFSLHKYRLISCWLWFIIIMFTTPLPQ